MRTAKALMIPDCISAIFDSGYTSQSSLPLDPSPPPPTRMGFEQVVRCSSAIIARFWIHHNYSRMWWRRGVVAVVFFSLRMTLGGDAGALAVAVVSRRDRV